VFTAWHISGGDDDDDDNDENGARVLLTTWRRSQRAMGLRLEESVRARVLPRPRRLTAMAAPQHRGNLSSSSNHSSRRRASTPLYSRCLHSCTLPRSASRFHGLRLTAAASTPSSAAETRPLGPPSPPPWPVILAVDILSIIAVYASLDEKPNGRLGCPSH
jgi:hypothetical protein